jgi:hypothetical protein
MLWAKHFSHRISNIYLPIKLQGNTSQTLAGAWSAGPVLVLLAHTGQSRHYALICAKTVEGKENRKTSRGSRVENIRHDTAFVFIVHTVQC